MSESEKCYLVTAEQNIVALFIRASFQGIGYLRFPHASTALSAWLSWLKTPNEPFLRVRLDNLLSCERDYFLKS